MVREFSAEGLGRSEVAEFLIRHAPAAPMLPETFKPTSVPRSLSASLRDLSGGRYGNKGRGL